MDTRRTDTGAVTVAESGTGALVMDGQIRIVDDKATASASEGVVTITSPGVKPGGTLVANNVKIYNDTVESIILSFDYKAENCSAFSESEKSGRYTAVLTSGDYAEMSITGIVRISNNTAKLTLSNFDYKSLPESSDVTVDYDDSIGGVTVNGNTVNAGEAVAVSYENGGVLTAIPKAGVKFAGWIDPETGKLYSRETSYAVKPIEPVTIEAVFMGENTAAYYLIGNEYIADDFNTAMDKVGVTESKTVVLLKDTELSAGKYVVPAGVTLLIPFDDANNLYTDDPDGIAEYENPSPYCTLTLGEGADLIIDGSVSLSAKHYAANGGGRGSGAPTGDISWLATEKDSTVTVNSGGYLYAYGFVTGEGNVIAKSGSTIYELFQIEDFRGGSATMNIAKDNMKKGLLPISQYYVQNIEVPLTFEPGAVEKVYASLRVENGSIYGSEVQFIGSSSAMFHLEEGCVVKSYDGKTDRLIFDVDGKIGLSSIKVEMAGASIDSSMFDLPINSNISVKLNEGAVTINQDVALLPGSEIVIEEGAICTLAKDVNVFVYDLEQWEGYVGTSNLKVIPSIYSPTRTYERTEADLVDAAIKVNGTLDAREGFVYTTTDADYKGGGANIYSTGGGIVMTGTGAPPEHYQYVQNDAEPFKLINLLPVNLKNADGGHIQTIETGVGTYTYTDGVWMCGHEIIKEVETKAPTCTEFGEKVVTCAMEDVQAGYGHTYTVKIDKLPHTPVTDDGKDATCTETGLTEGSHCDVCNEILVERETIDALGHA